jgi:hypothetical protein
MRQPRGVSGNGDRDWGRALADEDRSGLYYDLDINDKEVNDLLKAACG